MPATDARSIIAAADAFLDARLKAAVEWLDWAQPADALAPPMCLTLDTKLAGGVLVSIDPFGNGMRPAIVFETTGPGDHRRGLGTEELIRWVGVLTEVATLAGTWSGGEGCIWWTVLLARTAGPGLVSARERWQAGCTEHPKRGYPNPKCLCGWAARGRARLLVPTGWR